NFARGLAYRPLEDITHAKPAPDFLDIDGAAFEGEARIASDYEQPFKPRKRRRNLLNHSIGKIFLLWIARHVLERQHRDGGLVREWWGRTQPIARCARRSSTDSENADGLGDVLELLLTAILEANVQLAFDFAVDFFGNQDAARIGDPFQPDSNVDPVAVEIAVLPNDHVTEVEPDAQLEWTATLGEMILHLGLASHSGQGTCELGERAITRCLDQSAVVSGEARRDQVPLEPLELSVGGFLRALHHRRVADHIGGQDRRQPPLNTLFGQGRSPCSRSIRWHQITPMGCSARCFLGSKSGHGPAPHGPTK